MATHGYKTGARTRNVVNIADVGSTTAKAYEIIAANTAPSGATDGYRNLYGQKTLHVLVHNNGLAASGGGAVTVAANKITIWVYKSALGGTASWAPLRVPVHDNSSGVLKFPTAVIPDAIAPTAGSNKYHMVFPIEGAERVAVVLGASPFTGGTPVEAGGTLDIYLGVNTI